MSYKDFSFDRSLGRFLMASLLLNALIVLSIFTMSPTESPAGQWLTEYHKIRFAISPVETEEELADLHEGASELAGEECIACHGDKEDSDLPLHQIHLTSDLLPGLACPDCHRSISLEERTNEYSVRLVDVGFCKECHSEFPGLESNSPMKPEDFDVDCTTCHTGRSAYEHAKHYLSHVIAPQECKGCHGGRVLPWSPRHERADWLEMHGREALEVGEESCFQCHEFGLQFCDECHSEKPPSHQDEDAWLRDHKARAAADTRTCITCHEPDDCRECHVDHEDDWYDRHPTEVKAEGSDRCWGCHSESFCGYCHIQTE